MKFQDAIRGTKTVRTYNSIEELPFDVRRNFQCCVWSVEGFVGIDYDFKNGDYSQIMPCDIEAKEWIKQRLVK